jgi:hypothetical protein
LLLPTVNQTARWSATAAQSVTQSCGENAAPSGAEKASNWPLSNAIGAPMLCQGDGEPDTLSVTLAFVAVNVVGQVGINMIVAVCCVRNFFAGANYSPVDN